MSKNNDGLRARLLAHLKELHLPAMRQRYEELGETARQENMSHEAYLLALCEEESQVRRVNRIERLLRASRLPREKTIEALDRGSAI